MGMVFMFAGVLVGCGNSGDRVVSEQTTNQEEVTQTVPQEDVKIGLAQIVDISQSYDAGEEDGNAQTNVSIAAVTVDGEGKILSCKIDSVQVDIGFGKDGKLVTDLATKFQSKQELGDEYGMKKASAIGKEWYEQADAFAEYCIGKTADEVKGIAVTEEGKAQEVDLAASCSVNILGFQDIVVKAVENAK